MSPSLYERDAYQARLRAHPEHRYGMRFDVQWRADREGFIRLEVVDAATDAGVGERPPVWEAA